METIELILRIIASVVVGAAALGLIYAFTLLLQEIKHQLTQKKLNHG